MRLFSTVPLLVASASLAGATPAPALSDMQQQLRFASTEAPALPLVSWLSGKLSALVGASSKDVVTTFDEEPVDKSIWEFIQDTPDLSQLKKVLKYAGKGSKELLDDKDKKITFFGASASPV